MKKILPLLLAALFSAGCGRGSELAGPVAADPPEARQPDLVEGGIDQALMERAIARARQTQDQFVAALTSPPAAASDFFIKRQLGNQHVWLDQVEWDGQSFSAAVSNDPLDVADLKAGDRVEVKPQELTDWMYVEDGVLHGGYTVRVLHYQSSPAEQQATLRNQPFTIPPIDF